ncbi:hypothetical protein [Salinarimonas ramus]|uniref:Uncharacterized protein n=1 Tax=Salinarimonas ramus TaxID=690164 RepID=A0A917QDK1_9HYPH|nr:hypothetical protein [Salinarimonas ramus]GGK45246.1 hypothetical protein GCM10011322_35510 [Salinarimonas ramus]
MRSTIVPCALAALLLTTGLAAAQDRGARDPADWEAKIPWITPDEPDWIDSDEVVDSFPPGITPLGRTPPNELPGESTDELQDLIDETRDEASERERRRLGER